MVMIDYMKMVKEYLRRNNFQTRLYPTLLSDEHNAVVCKKIVDDGIRLTDVILSKDIVGISEQLGESLFSLFGICHTMGIPIESVFDEVYRAKYYKKRCNVAAAIKPALLAKAEAMNDRSDKVSPK